MKKTILIVSFGTSHRDARENSLDRIWKDVKEMAGPGVEVVQAYTSEMILDVLHREGIEIFTVEQAVKQILNSGTRELLVVPTHMIPGIEYHKMLRALQPYKSQFQRLEITTTVLEQPEDCERLVPVLQNMLAFQPDKEYILMGHGTEAAANLRYLQMQQALEQQGITNVRIASVEAKPDLEDALVVLQKRKKEGISQVEVHPFMVVAGDHAKNDMAGEVDSYVTRLQEAGFLVNAVIKGLGEYSQFRNLYLEKLARVLTSEE
jgi:sirohydrochlorin cobaltochelatase